MYWVRGGKSSVSLNKDHQGDIPAIPMNETPYPIPVQINYMGQYPEIDYKHVLSELSVNRKDPCEVIRELISNSYDADASKIKIFPLLKEKGFIYFDNGTGLSETTEINGITPYKAFFL